MISSVASYLTGPTIKRRMVQAQQKSDNSVRATAVDLNNSSIYRPFISFRGNSIYVPTKNCPFTTELYRSYKDGDQIQIDPQIAACCQRFNLTAHAVKRESDRDLSVKDLIDTITCGDIYLSLLDYNDMQSAAYNYVYRQPMPTKENPEDYRLLSVLVDKDYNIITAMIRDDKDYKFTPPQYISKPVFNERRDKKFIRTDSFQLLSEEEYNKTYGDLNLDKIVVGNYFYEFPRGKEEKQILRMVSPENIEKALRKGDIFYDKMNPKVPIFVTEYKPINNNYDDYDEKIIMVTASKNFNKDTPYTNNEFKIKEVKIIDKYSWNSPYFKDNERYTQNKEMKLNRSKLVQGLNINYMPKDKIIIDSSMPALNIFGDSFVFEEDACKGADSSMEEIKNVLTYGEIFIDNYQGQVYDKQHYDHELIVYRYEMPKKNNNGKKTLFIGVCKRDDSDSRYIINKVMVSPEKFTDRYKNEDVNLTERRERKKREEKASVRAWF